MDTFEVRQTRLSGTLAVTTQVIYFIKIYASILKCIAKHRDRRPTWQRLKSIAERSGNIYQRESAARYEEEVIFYTGLKETLVDRILKDARFAKEHPKPAEHLGPLELDPIRRAPYNGPGDLGPYLIPSGNEPMTAEYIFLLNTEKKQAAKQPAVPK